MSGLGLAVLLAAVTVVSFTAGWVFRDARARGLPLYPWGAKRVPYASIKAVQRLPFTGANRIRRMRIWGSGDLIHWWNFDAGRPHKDAALVLDVGHRVRPTITPDEPEVVERILHEQVRSQEMPA